MRLKIKNYFFKIVHSTNDFMNKTKKNKNKTMESRIEAT